MTDDMDTLAARMRDGAFWAKFAPDLHTDGSALGKAMPLSPAMGHKARADVVEQGFMAFDKIHGPEATRPILQVMAALHAAKLPTVFAFVFDETWALFTSLGHLWSAIVGDDWVFLPAIWGWYLDKPGDAGWKPHCDRPDVVCLREDGSPLSFSAWIPLTPAVPANGCIYILPMGYGRHTTVDVNELAHVRAMPAPAGSVLGWNSAVTHWGGRATKDMPCPRVSLSIEMQTAQVAPLDAYVIPRNEIPPLYQRVRLIGESILRYGGRSELNPQLAGLARAILREKYVEIKKIPKDAAPGRGGGG